VHARLQYNQFHAFINASSTRSVKVSELSRGHSFSKLTSHI